MLRGGGELELGGRDFDNELFELVWRKLKARDNIDCKRNVDAEVRQKILYKCEPLKIELSTLPTAW